MNVLCFKFAIFFKDTYLYIALLNNITLKILLIHFCVHFMLIIIFIADILDVRINNFFI